MQAKNNVIEPPMSHGYFSEIYLKITGNSNGVLSMSRMISPLYQHKEHQSEFPVDALTFPGALY